MAERHRFFAAQTGGRHEQERLEIIEDTGERWRAWCTVESIKR